MRDTLSPLLGCVKRELFENPPGVDAEYRAGVLVPLVGCGDGLRLVMVEKKAGREYPWSGDLAFPGGMRKPGEKLLDTIAREAMEEAGIPLDGCEVLGFLPPARPRNAPHLLVAPLAAYCGSCEKIPRKGRDGEEVERVVLVGLPRTVHRVSFLHPVRRVVVEGYKDWYGNRVWGMSLRIIEALLGFLHRCGYGPV